MQIVKSFSNFDFCVCTIILHFQFTVICLWGENKDHADLHWKKQTF